MRGGPGWPEQTVGGWRGPTVVWRVGWDGGGQGRPRAQKLGQVGCMGSLHRTHEKWGMGGAGSVQVGCSGGLHCLELTSSSC